MTDQSRTEREEPREEQTARRDDDPPPDPRRKDAPADQRFRDWALI